MIILEPEKSWFLRGIPNKIEKQFLCDEKSGTALAVPAVLGMPPLLHEADLTTDFKYISKKTATLITIAIIIETRYYMCTEFELTNNYQSYSRK